MEQGYDELVLMRWHYSVSSLCWYDSAHGMYERRAWTDGYFLRKKEEFFYIFSPNENFFTEEMRGKNERISTSHQKYCNVAMKSKFFEWF